jgi:hypothetical protein
MAFADFRTKKLRYHRTASSFEVNFSDYEVSICEITIRQSANILFIKFKRIYYQVKMPGRL